MASASGRNTPEIISLPGFALGLWVNQSLPGIIGTFSMPRVYLSDWLTVRRVRIHALLLAVGIWTAFFVNMHTPGLRDHGGLIKGADFLHFYTLGTLAREGHGDLLYDIPAQTNLLQQIVPEARNYIYVPLYGPQVSLFFYPFAQMPYAYALGSMVVTQCADLWSMLLCRVEALPESGKTWLHRSACGHRFSGNFSIAGLGTNFGPGPAFFHSCVFSIAE